MVAFTGITTSFECAGTLYEVPVGIRTGVAIELLLVSTKRKYTNESLDYKILLHWN